MTTGQGSGLTCPCAPVADRPDLRQSCWQDIGRYVVRWVSEPNSTSWRADGIFLRERVEERAHAIIDWETMERWQRDGLPAEIVARGRELAARYGW